MAPYPECVVIDAPFSQSALNDAVEGLSDIPRRAFFLGELERAISRTVEIASQIERELHVGCAVSYSVKTNPSAYVLGSVLEHGVCAECISLAELLHTQRMGFCGRLCTLNGPGKWWPWELVTQVDEPAIINCDSLADAEGTLEVIRSLSWNHCVLGFRISPPGIDSRFGIDLEDAGQFAEFCRVLRNAPKTQPLGLHVHCASSAIGLKAWVDAIDGAARLCAMAFSCASRTCSYIDVGGGWRPPDLDVLHDVLFSAAERAIGHLHEVKTLQIEPGKMLVESAGVLACRAIGRRGLGPDADLAVTAASSDVPDTKTFPHRMMWRPSKGGAWHALGHGSGRILGRLCMESDILRTGVSIPTELHEDDILVICDTGAYDTSMSYSFGIAY